VLFPPREDNVVTRVGVVDLGTNSTRLLVADVENGGVRELDRRLAITRLGESVDARRVLLSTALARVRNVLVDYRRAAEEHGVERTLALGTSAVRDAENGEAFLGEVEWSYGFATRLLTGDEEALLTFRGVATGGEIADDTVVIDVGGGSTEVILGGAAGLSFHESLDFGCVRLSERFLADDPPTHGQLASAGAYVRSLLEERVPETVRPRGAIGVAGTVTTLATLYLGLHEEDPKLVHGRRLSAVWIAGELERVSRMRLDEIRALPGVHPDRAPVLVAGIVAIDAAIRHFGLTELEVSENDVMHGGALLAAELPAPAEGDAPPGAFTCC
jgi:exopolyphosphatase / guanosine-5'-triphosphate,3'-diphosphate pyrophosphatase